MVEKAMSPLYTDSFISKVAKVMNPLCLVMDVSDIANNCYRVN